MVRGRFGVGWANDDSRLDARQGVQEVKVEMCKSKSVGSRLPRTDAAQNHGQTKGVTLRRELVVRGAPPAVERRLP